MFGLSLHVAPIPPHHYFPTRMKIFDGHVNLGSQAPWQATLQAIHYVAISAVEGYVIPGPICNSANFIAPT